MMVRRATTRDVRPGPASEATVSPTAPVTPWVYTIEMSVDKVLTYMKPDLDFADCYDGKIVRRQVDRDPVEAGRFLAIRMRIEDAHQLGASARDGFGERMAPYYRALFDPRTDD
jgi:hypothetical protein